MAFCPQCGAQAQGNFCPACGASLSGSGASATPPQSNAGVPARPLDENIISALCYSLWAITGVLFLVLEPYNRSKTIRFHAFQSIFVGVALMAIGIALSMLAYTPFVGLIFSVVMLVFPLFCFGLWILLMYKAYNREQFSIPVLGDLARKQA
jgi:uncharacterized membrane protein